MFGTPPTQQQYGSGQPPGSGFSAPPAAPSPAYGNQQFAAPSAYGASQAQPGYQPPQGARPQGQPSYGPQSGYGAPPQPSGYPVQQGLASGYGVGYPAAPPKKSRTGLWIGVVLGVVVLAAVVFVLFFTLSKTVLDPSAVQQDVAAQFQDQEGVSIELTCPSDMEVKVGNTYECTGTTADSEDVTLIIAISDTNGNYTWQEQPK